MKKEMSFGFLQALGLALYILFVSLVIQNAIKWFGPMNNFTGPIISLSLLSISVLVCGFISLGYPIKVFFIEKNYKRAINIVGFTTIFLIIFLVLFILSLFTTR